MAKNSKVMANAITNNGKAMANAITNDSKCYNKNSKVNQTKVNQNKENLKEVLDHTIPNQNDLRIYNSENKNPESGNGFDWFEKQEFLIPTLENVESLVKHEMLNISPVDWFNKHQAMDWKINGEPIRFWQDVARYHHKKGWSKPNEEKIETGSPVSTRGHFTKHKINEEKIETGSPVSTRGHFTKHKINGIIIPEQLSGAVRANEAFVNDLLNKREKNG